MRTVTSRITVVMLLSLLYLPSVALAGITRTVVMRDYGLNPSQLTIHAGDTVRWINVGLEREPHNVVAQDGSFSSGAPALGRPFAFTFMEAGYYPYRCTLHPGQHLVGAITVEGTVNTLIDIDPGHSGNWWGGPSRNGEGAQIEVADGGDDGLVFVATIYAYGPTGGQIFVIGLGTPQGNTVDVEVFITEGGVWGDGLDPDAIVEKLWGTGTFTAENCELIHMSLFPDLEYAAEGYSPIEYDLVRLTTPMVACPYAE